MSPAVINHLLQQTLPVITENFHVMADMFILRYSPTSVLRRGPNGPDVKLNSIMPPYEIKMQEINLLPEEQLEFQLWHRASAR